MFFYVNCFRLSIMCARLYFVGLGLVTPIRNAVQNRNLVYKVLTSTNLPNVSLLHFYHHFYHAVHWTDNKPPHAYPPGFEGSLVKSINPAYYSQQSIKHNRRLQAFCSSLHTTPLVWFTFEGFVSYSCCLLSCRLVLLNNL